MANDFKRMWTKEELKSNSVLDLPDIPEVVDANSPDIIRVQGKLYYKNIKEGSTGLTGTKWYFNETIIYTSSINANINYIINGTTYNNLSVFNYGSVVITNAPTPTFYNNGWYEEAYRTIEITGGTDVEDAELIAFLEVNASLLTSTKTSYNYKELGSDEELVKSIPTDVSIIEDQGKLELMLEHDGNVLAVNDTPNQFLQRNLNKPRATNISVAELNDYINIGEKYFCNFYMNGFNSEIDSDYYGIIRRDAIGYSINIMGDNIFGYGEQGRTFFIIGVLINNNNDITIGYVGKDGYMSTLVPDNFEEITLY